MAVIRAKKAMQKPQGNKPNKGKGKTGGGGGQWVFVPQAAAVPFRGGGGGGFRSKGKGKGGGKGKGKGKGKRNIGMVRRTAKTQPDKCVWIGGLPEQDKDKELNKKLKDWINKQLGGGDACKFVDIGPRGSGGAIFGDDGEASNAIAALNGKKFQGKTLEFDVYVKGWKGDEDEE